MAILKCRMCGGDLPAAQDGESVVECEYCGSRQTIPTADNEKKITLFGRAGRLLRACEFDKAAGIFENIVGEFPEEAEAYWGLVLCKFGIEYVDDPATGEKVPTCHRSSFQSVMEDDNFEQACENADGVARRQYREEAKQIENLRRRIIEVSANEEPYDVFISYKETDDKGERTLDSVIAQDIYDALTEKGYRVFFSRISLEDKLGVEYEPYIFAALNSAKVMLSVGTDYENFEAVWVKNEWSRFLALMAAGEKKVLIPVFKNLDAYDMPKEFAKLAAQDMGKVGAMQDLLRGIDKILGGNEKPAAEKPETVIVQQSSVGPGVDSLLKRGQFFLEDKDWNSASEYFDRVLDIDPERAEAYLGKALAAVQMTSLAELRKTISVEIFVLKDWDKAIRFGGESFTKKLKAARADVEESKRLEDERRAEEERIRREKEAEEERLRLEKEAEAKAKAERIRLENVRKLSPIRDKLKKVKNVLYAGYDHTVGLCSGGTVFAEGSNNHGQCEVKDWTDIVAVSAGCSHTVGLHSNGSVVAVGWSKDNQCDVIGWKDIIAVAAGDFHTVGLHSDGTVVAVGLNKYGGCDVQSWTDIVSVAAGKDHTVGLCSNGTVLAVGNNQYGQCEVGDWKDIVAISARDSYTVGLRSDGTVTAAGENDKRQCNVEYWTEIVAISAGRKHTVGLRSDGTVLATKYIDDYYKGQSNVSGWNDIVSVSAGGCHTVGLRADGTVLAVGYNYDGRCNVSYWKLFNSFENYEEESRKARRIVELHKHEEERKRYEEALRAKRRKQGLCQHCGGEFKGLFVNRCSKCGKEKDYFGNR